MNNYNNVYNALAEVIDNNYDTLAEMIKMDLINAEQVLNLFVNWHGLESLTNDFMEFVKEEINY